MKWTTPDYQVHFHHRVLAQALQDLYYGRHKNVMVVFPPQYGKTTMASIGFPAWCLGMNPSERIIAGSTTDDLASFINRSIQRKITSDSYKELFPHTRINEGRGDRQAAQPVANSSFFETIGSGGHYLSAGVRTRIVGRTGSILIADDLIGSAEEANSKTKRDAVWEWWNNDLKSRGIGRLEGGQDRILLIGTRWHEDDVHGRLLKTQGDQWYQVKFPAILDRYPPDYDPRKIGDVLWPSKHNIDDLLAIKRGLGKNFQSLYQGDPVSAEGDVFKVEWLRYYTKIPRKPDQIIQSWDLNFGQKTESGSYVVGLIWGRLGPDFYLMHVYRERMEFTEIVACMEGASETYPNSTILVENKAAGASAISWLKRKIPKIIPVEPKGDKVVRAESTTPYFEAGNVYLKQGASWLVDYVDEMSNFPLGTYDDQVDATSQVLNWVSGKNQSRVHDLNTL